MQHVLPLGGGKPLAAAQPVGQRAPVLVSQAGASAPRRFQSPHPNRATRSLLKEDTGSAWAPVSVEKSTYVLPTVSKSDAASAGKSSAAVGAFHLGFGGKACRYHDQGDVGGTGPLPSLGDVPPPRPTRGAVGLRHVSDRKGSVLGHECGSLSPVTSGRRRPQAHTSPVRPDERALGKRLSFRHDAADAASNKPALGRRMSLGYQYHDRVTGNVMASQGESQHVADSIHQAGRARTPERRQLRRVTGQRQECLEVNGFVRSGIQEQDHVRGRRRPDKQTPWASDHVQAQGSALAPGRVEYETKAGHDPSGRKLGVRTKDFSSHTGVESPKQRQPPKFKPGRVCAYEHRTTAEYDTPMPALGPAPSPRHGEQRGMGVYVPPKAEEAPARPQGVRVIPQSGEPPPLPGAQATTHDDQPRG